MPLRPSVAHMPNMAFNGVGYSWQSNHLYTYVVAKLRIIWAADKAEQKDLKGPLIISLSFC